MTLRAAIFDMDGLIFDTERLCFEAWKAVSRDRGCVMDDELLKACVGRNARDTREIVFSWYGPGFPYDELDGLARKWMIANMTRNGPPEKPGVRALFGYLSARGVPMALATSTSERSARWMIDRAALTRYFSACAFGGETERGKPEPDIFLLAMKRLGATNPAECVAFEDSPAGLSAATRAGMNAVFVPDMIIPDGEILSRIWKRAPSLESCACDAFFED
jgi:HAD superfamily hydrolase (TIGR01509 family)